MSRISGKPNSSLRASWLLGDLLEVRPDRGLPEHARLRRRLVDELVPQLRRLVDRLRASLRVGDGQKRGAAVGEEHGRPGCEPPGRTRGATAAAAAAPPPGVAGDEERERRRRDAGEAVEQPRDAERRAARHVPAAAREVVVWWSENQAPPARSASQTATTARRRRETASASRARNARRQTPSVVRPRRPDVDSAQRSRRRGLGCHPEFTTGGGRGFYSRRKNGVGREQEPGDVGSGGPEEGARGDRGARHRGRAPLVHRPRGAPEELRDHARASWRARSTTAWASTARRSPASTRSRSRTWSRSPIRRRSASCPDGAGRPDDLRRRHARRRAVRRRSAPRRCASRSSGCRRWASTRSTSARSSSTSSSRTRRARRRSTRAATSR